ncbi:MAG: adenine deaminase [Candidatus Hadarchaeota archaeon]
MYNLPELLEVARGDKQPDLILSGRIFSVFTGEVFEGDVAIYRSKIAGIGEYEGRNRIETDGIILPGFMDSHMHLESTLLTPSEFARAVLPHGTTSVFIDPHEIANVAGVDGIKYVYEASRNLPVNFFLNVPSCVPAIKGLETYGAEINAGDVSKFITWDGVVGLAEMMNFPGVICGDEMVLRKIEAIGDRVVDGHAPGLRSKGLNTYIAAGVQSDHECTSADEAVEKVRKGMKVMIREGSVAKNLADLVKVVNAYNSENFMLASDDFLPIDMEQGHMDYRMKLCVENGLPPEIAIKMATINTARYFGLNDLGAVAPGYTADLAVVDNFTNFQVKMVLKDGKVVWDGKPTVEIKSRTADEVKHMVMLPDINEGDLKIKAKGKKCKVIELIPGQITTKKSEMELPVENGFAIPDIKNNVAKITVVDRYGRGKYIGLGFVKGFGLNKGAIASSVSHDSHNCVCLGVNDKDMLTAIKRIGELQGGFVVVDGEVKAELPLPVAGLISDLEYEEVTERLKRVYKTVKELGIDIEHPFTSLSFLSLPVIPELKITDFGLVDVSKMELVDLWS